MLARVMQAPVAGPLGPTTRLSALYLKKTGLMCSSRALMGVGSHSKTTAPRGPGPEVPSAPFPAVRRLRHGVPGAPAWVGSSHLDSGSGARVQEIRTPKEATVRRWRWPTPGLPPWLRGAVLLASGAFCHTSSLSSAPAPETCQCLCTQSRSSVHLCP